MLSGVILTKNEEDNIQDAIDSLEFVDEILIVDDLSTDSTLDIVKKNNNSKIKIYEKRKESFAEQRNFAQQKTKHDYIFFLDADERVTKELQKEILLNIQNSDTVKAWKFKRQDRLWGQKLNYGETAGVRLTRLGKRNAGKWVGSVHEEWIIDGEVKELENPILHFPHQSIAEFISEINLYTDLRAEELFQSGKRVNIIEIFIYPLGKFVDGYIFKRGYKDGIPGFVVATLMSFHSFLVRGKLWQLWRKI